MDGNERRDEILQILTERNAPISGTEFSRLLKVSRQVIVQDIALLRAINKNILSTNKGYVLYSPEVPKKAKRTILVKHSQSEILDELYTIVDCGGRVSDVVVEHEIYGQITVDLIINNRRDAQEFWKKIENGNTRPLNHLTDGVHYHTIEAESEAILDTVERALDEKGYRVSNSQQK